MNRSKFRSKAAQFPTQSLDRPQSNWIRTLTHLGRGGMIALLLLTAACGTGTQTTTEAPAETETETAASGTDGALKLGSLLPITGDLAQYGTTMQDTAQLLIETANACDGVLGQSVQLIPEDDQTDPAAGASGMTKLTEVDQVAGVIGAAGSAVSSAAVDIAVRNQVVQISPSSTSPEFTERAKEGDFDGFWFRTAPPDTFQGDALAQLSNEQGFENVAVMAINNDYGNGLIQAFTTAFTDQGGTVTNEANPTLYAENATTFDSELSAAFSGNPDAVLLVAYPETGSLILRSAYEQGLLDGETQIILTDGMKTDQLAELVGQSPDGEFIASGVIGTAPSAGGPGLDAFNELYTSRFDRDPNVFDPNTWDAAAVLLLAAEAAQSGTGTDLKDQIREVANPPGQEVTDICEALDLVRDGETINYEGASGSVDFNDEGDVVGAYDVWTITDEGTLEVQSTIEVGVD
jgi:ABC-type branched-subunit amino acid transport system substrate-binding protein